MIGVPESLWEKIIAGSHRFMETELMSEGKNNDQPTRSSDCCDLGQISLAILNSFNLILHSTLVIF